MPLVETLAVNLALVLGVMFLCWLLSLTLRDSSIVDPVWGAGFVLVAWGALLLNSPEGHRPVLLTVLTTVWGMRLALFLAWRKWGHGEDSRYAAMRDYHGRRYWCVGLFTVFLLQGVILWFVAFPLQVAAVENAPTPFGWLDALGVLLWAIGLFFEAVGDWQLARFQADPKSFGRVMDGGLWRYTRHPNYFGDFCVWWGLFIIAASGGAWWTVGRPLLMSFLLLRVSGVTLLESNIKERRPGYAAYQARTNAFFPGPPRAIDGRNNGNAASH